MCKQSTAPCHYSTSAMLFNDLRHSRTYVGCQSVPAPFQKPPPVPHSILILSFAPPPNILILSLVTFLLCQLPSPFALSPLHLLLLALSHTSSIRMLPLLFSLFFSFTFNSTVALNPPHFHLWPLLILWLFTLLVSSPPCSRSPQSPSDTSVSEFSLSLAIFISSSDRTRGFLLLPSARPLPLRCSFCPTCSIFSPSPVFIPAVSE